MSAKTNDTVFLAIGGAFVLGACAWAFLQQSDISALNTPVQAPMGGSVYEPSALSVGATESRSWASPAPQSAGEKWLYDVFTPPKIYYNVQTKKFVVEPPVWVAKDTTDDLPVVEQPITFGVELARVEQPLFRLQLVGYVGEGANARGTFEDQSTKQIIFGTTGKKLPDLNLEIVRFSAERRRTKVAGETEIVDTVATATVRDTVSGVETNLDVKARTPEGPIHAVLKLDDGTERSVASGETFTIGSNSYLVGVIDSAIPSVVVTKSGGDLEAPETQTLLIPPPPVVVPVEGAMSEDGSVQPPAQTGEFSGF